MNTQVLESGYHKPINAEGGLYVLIRYQHGYSEAAKDLAMQEAATRGYDPDGRAFIGMPTSHGIKTSQVAIWFYEKKEVR